jgi:hypothetical protein
MLTTPRPHRGQPEPYQNDSERQRQQEYPGPVREQEKPGLWRRLLGGGSAMVGPGRGRKEETPETPVQCQAHVLTPYAHWYPCPGILACCPPSVGCAIQHCPACRTAAVTWPENRRAATETYSYFPPGCQPRRVPAAPRWVPCRRFAVPSRAMLELPQSSRYITRQRPGFLGLRLVHPQQEGFLHD